MTIPTPTSNWTERPLKGRDFGTARPAEPVSFDPGAQAADVAVPDHQDELFETAPERRADADLTGPRGSLNDIFDAPLTSKSDLDESRTDALLEAPLTSKLDGTARGALFDAPLTSKSDLERVEARDRADHVPVRPLAHAAPIASAGAYSGAAAASPRARDLDEDEAYTPAYGRSASSSRGRTLMLAAPVAIAAVAAVGYLALSGGGAEPAVTTEAPAAAEPVTAAPSVAAAEPLTGMGVSDLGIAPAQAEPMRTAEAVAPTPRAQPRSSTPAQTRTAPAEPTPPATTAEAEPTIAAEPTLSQPTVTPITPTTPATEPLIVTEPLPVG